MIIRGGSSAIERFLAKEEVAGLIPVPRSLFICPKLVNASLLQILALDMVQLRVLKYRYLRIAGSSKGRTTDFGSVYHGSNPCPAAILQYYYF